MTYILFYLVTITYLNGPMTSGTAEFGSKEQCEKAGHEVEGKFGGYVTKINWLNNVVRS